MAMRYRLLNAIRFVPLAVVLFAGSATGQRIWYVEARGGIEPLAHEEFNYSKKWEHYTGGIVCGLSAGFDVRKDISLNASLGFRIRPYQEHVDSNSWFWTTTVWRGEPAVISEFVAGPRLHFGKISKGAYMQFAGGIRSETIGEVTGDVYNWGRTSYMGEEVKPEHSLFRPVGSTLFGYDFELGGRFYLGLEMNVYLTFDKVEASYSSLAKIGYRIQQR